MMCLYAATTATTTATTHRRRHHYHPPTYPTRTAHHGPTTPHPTPQVSTEPSASTSAYRCFLGAANISATFSNGSVRCTTTPFSGGASSGYHLPLHFSLNAQDPVGPAATFVVHGRPIVSSATPLSGPTAGGTLVLFGGSGFGNGSDYRCRFGAGLLADEAPGASVVPATFDGAAHTLACTSPPGSLGPAPLFLSLNGQNFADASRTFQYLAPLAPLTLAPARGPSDGATRVTVETTADVSSADALSCRYGQAVVPAVDVGNALRCESPPALLAPALASASWLEAAAPPLPVEWLRGDATLQGDEVRLTTGDMSSSGALLLPAGALNSSAGGHAHFRAQFDLKVHGGSGADGLSLSYGVLPDDAVGEQGGGFGLRLSFSTAMRCPPPLSQRACPALIVRYANELLRTVPLASDFRAAGFVNTLIEYSAQGLHVRQ